MTESRTYTYKLLKGPWGVRISLTAQVVHAEPSDGERVSAEVPVWIAFEETASGLDEAVKAGLRDGLAAVASEVSDSVAGTPATVIIHRMSYVESDFQEEGVPVAMCRWAEEEFGLPPRRIDASFDRTANRYSFDWR
ncbi:hypothetical protein [Streptomyces sp. TLI_146]|uniref:hypothetical protein n=1 Tax=Streptomyces sp. TLI_146 TaxID=1938858 RepID=UPI000C7129C3|nr:hypothetical protein [Streptomyces sp. TLI_146]PKV89891.1 hypothetical protein BX283_7538 [Streptomyces sp. TLI_146]